MATGENHELPLPIRFQRQWPHKQSADQKIKNAHMKWLDKRSEQNPSVREPGEIDHELYRRRKEELVSKIRMIHRIHDAYGDTGGY